MVGEGAAAQELGHQRMLTTVTRVRVSHSLDHITPTGLRTVGRHASGLGSRVDYGTEAARLRAGLRSFGRPTEPGQGCRDVGQCGSEVGLIAAGVGRCPLPVDGNRLLLGG